MDVPRGRHDSTDDLLLHRWRSGDEGDGMFRDPTRATKERAGKEEVGKNWKVVYSRVLELLDLSHKETLNK